MDVHFKIGFSNLRKVSFSHWPMYMLFIVPYLGLEKIIALCSAIKVAYSSCVGQLVLNELHKHK